jgi:predicted CopG family antitoxin
MAKVTDKRIPVTAKVWEDLSGLKAPGETFAQLLGEMIEHEKKRRLVMDMEEIEREGEFVELPLGLYRDLKRSPF